MTQDAESKNYNIGLFFGAGAETGYGFPSGGKFALEIFRRSAENAKSKLRELLNNIDQRSIYASDFLPKDFEKKRISTFGKGDYKTLIKSSMEYRRQFIIDFLNNFDSNAEEVIKGWPITHEQLKEKYKEITGDNFGSKDYGHTISLNEKLGKDITLFSSDYFSALLEVYRAKRNNKLLRQCLVAILQLLVGCCGHKLVSELNDQIFTKAPDDIPIFDDITGLLQIEVSQAGLSALELILEEDPLEITEDLPPGKIFAEFARSLLEKLMEKCLDYQALMDSHFRYLFEPNVHWGNFTKIVTFLNHVREYLTNDISLDEEKVRNGPGFYHDLLKFAPLGLTVSHVGTTNYNRLISDIAGDTIGDRIEHLNGSVSDYYDPYLNKIIRLPNEDAYTTHPQIIVPFLFTQSGIKPLTSVEMSQRYVRLYEEYQRSDAVVVAGFSFNGDDGHINGLFRDLIKDQRKKVFICHYNETSHSEQEISKHYRRKLRLGEIPENLYILQIDKNRKTPDGKLWYEAVVDRMGSIKKLPDTCLYSMADSTVN